MSASGQPSVLVTGACGYLGSETIKELARRRSSFSAIVALDIRETPAGQRCAGVTYVATDVRESTIETVLRDNRIHTVVHLASIVTPGKKSNREFERSVDVLGTRNIVECCLRADVKHIIVASSGAAYGYYADNPLPLREDDALRGNPEFSYSDHKRQVEEMLASYRRSNPDLKQLILRPGTILGATTTNQITALFERSAILGVAGASTPFVFIWDQDVVACIVKGIAEQREGIYNLAGDGTVTMKEIAAMLHKRYISVPPVLLTMALRLLKSFGLSQYGPEQVNFLRYRPVLANDRLKHEFGYTPQKTSRETFEFYARSKGLL
ncbi:MAG: SDR family oxidoreductase [Candidatus Hydrogenedentes bacterium]|nr:SDR family oxidoreductase [Candidatus Hydrogenedentota bacterium]